MSWLKRKWYALRHWFEPWHCPRCGKSMELYYIEEQQFIYRCYSCDPLKFYQLPR